MMVNPTLRFKDDNGNDYPGWVDKKLDDITKIYLGLTYTPNYVKDGIPFLSCKNLKNGQIDWTDHHYISKEEFDNSTSNAKPKKGDILFGRVGTIGNPVVLENEPEFCIFVSLGFLRIKSKDTTSNYFLAQWMKSSFFNKLVQQKIAGSSQKNLNTGWLKTFSLGIPSLPEQQKIASFLSSIDEKINLIDRQLENLKQYKKSLLQQMFV